MIGESMPYDLPLKLMTVETPSAPVPLASARPSRVRNACLGYGPEGTRRARYHKIHLFGLDRGGERFDESATIEAGRTPVVGDVGPWRNGLSVCYDVRFPELYRNLSPVDENQCYVLAPAQGGRHENGRRTWGHTMLIDPWGEIVSVLPEGEGVVAGRLQRARLLEVRASLPALKHRVM